MKSPPPDTGPPNPGEAKSAEAEKTPITKEQPSSETEKDSGYSDSSSESLSSEDTPLSTTTSVTAATPDTPQAKSAYAPIYILQNIILKQSHLVLVQPPLRRHRKRAAPSSYLPILRSYPRIAPRIAPPPSLDSDLPKDTASAPPDAKVCKQEAPQLLEVSLRSLDLLRRTRETQRCIRELKAHTRLYERALQGEEGGWERLRRAMEKSGGYRKIPPAAPDSATTEEAMSTTEASTATEDDDSVSEVTEDEEEVTSPEKAVTSSEAAPSACDTGGAV
ncbi:uncharacterized protein ACNLHF_000242 [Anomaloglossus baeobatrachus]|uniref:uncharacterized protein LOC142250849 n=1 Tax=Anomaloglossus baeobatrachus TaxID=238106 RepID=UPI003F4F65CA